MASSGTSFAAMDQNSPHKRRHQQQGGKARVQNWQGPMDVAPTRIACEKAQALQINSLIDISAAIAELDIKVMSFLSECMKTVTKRDSGGQSNERAVLTDLEAIAMQFAGVKFGKYGFHPEYLKDMYLLRYYRQSELILFGMMDGDPTTKEPPPLRNAAIFECGLLMKLAEPIINLLEREAMRTGSFDVEIKSAIRERWYSLEARADKVGEMTGTNRTFPSWYKVNERIHDAAQRYHPAKGDAVSANPEKLSFQVLLGIFFGTLVCAVPPFAVGWQRCPHSKGTTADADFWFLVQSSVLQLVILIVVAMSLWSRSRLPKLVWAAPIGISVVFTLLAPVLYLLLPTEWSSFSSFVAMTAQAFMALQAALVGE